MWLLRPLVFTGEKNDHHCWLGVMAVLSQVQGLRSDGSDVAFSPVKSSREHSTSVPFCESDVMGYASLSVVLGAIFTGENWPLGSVAPPPLKGVAGRGKGGSRYVFALVWGCSV